MFPEFANNIRLGVNICKTNKISKNLKNAKLLLKEIAVKL
jgi:hypothetical protein